MSVLLHIVTFLLQVRSVSLIRSDLLSFVNFSGQTLSVSCDVTTDFTKTREITTCFVIILNNSELSG